MPKMPPMAPISHPKSAPPKHAIIFSSQCYSSEMQEGDSMEYELTTTSQREDPPSVDLRRIALHRLIFDNVLKNTFPHGCGGSFSRTGFV
jgi:hypothetical protein